MTPPLGERLRAASSSARLSAAMDAGATRDPAAIDVLVERCGIEPDFFVRDMLTWALLRQRADDVVPRLVEELASPFPQARSQALHTLSKIGDARAWPALTGALLHDEEDAVARAAWRAAVTLVPEGEEAALADDLATELGLRDRDSRQSLSRALVALGEPARAVLERSAGSGAFAARTHALATRLLLDGEADGFQAALGEAKRRLLP
ncbi:HEAT repeat domain-containing protein [Amnibacterium endophyticum]|uniref:HEAT repeat domain-containing protein n=1 Tax=Amnibacterium endophyticum TaxID=2109337 RepID=A0ABW4LG97_9MICO